MESFVASAPFILLLIINGKLEEQRYRYTQHKMFTIPLHRPSSGDFTYHVVLYTKKNNEERRKYEKKTEYVTTIYQIDYKFNKFPHENNQYEVHVDHLTTVGTLCSLAASLLATAFY